MFGAWKAQQDHWRTLRGGDAPLVWTPLVDPAPERQDQGRIAIEIEVASAGPQLVHVACSFWRRIKKRM